MKNKALIPFVFLFFAGFAARAQDCTSSFFPSKEGTKTEMTSYDKNGKEKGKTVTTIVSVKKTGTVTEYDLKSETTGTGNKITSTEFTAKCDGNTISVSMKSFLPSGTQNSTGSGEINIDATDLNFPNSIIVGQKLNDGKVTMTMNMGTMTMKTTINIVNRTVTGKESITTPERAFDCYKIEYNVESQVMNMNTKSKVKQWIARGVGTVKTENYNDKGELMGYSQLTSIK
jgi:hypothetical protein